MFHSSIIELDAMNSQTPNEALTTQAPERPGAQNSLHKTFVACFQCNVSFAFTALFPF